MKIDQSKAWTGHYVGLTEWLNENIAADGYTYVPCLEQAQLLAEIKFADEKDELIATLRWS